MQHFANRGITYITLCHNGDNQICDSARNSLNTHGGVSPFGAQVIAEMNRLGLMVDLSHAGEKSFYDALQISRTPIVCSHSNSRALCDVPRNITDEQMRALAAAGGVCQITLYNGFLRTDGNATITDAIRHMERRRRHTRTRRRLRTGQLHQGTAAPTLLRNRHVAHLGRQLAARDEPLPAKRTTIK